MGCWLTLEMTRRPKLGHLKSTLDTSTSLLNPKIAFLGLQSSCEEIWKFFTPVTTGTPIHVCHFKNGRNPCRISGRKAALHSYFLTTAGKKHIFEPFGENPGAIYPKFLCDTHCRSSCTYIPSFVQIGSGLGSYSLKVLSLSAKLIAI